MNYFLVDYESYDPDNIKEFSIFDFTTQEVEKFYINIYYYCDSDDVSA